jgi:Raf kinase inhibitor-like YbhB/YbcL family protein
MKIECPDLLNDDGFIKKDYTGDGANVSPEIRWSDAPEGTKSFAVYVHDPDAPMGDWVHWIIINIPADVNSIPKGGPASGEEVSNDFGRVEYGGPAPPSGTHRYYYIVYALSVEKLEGITKQNFLEKVNLFKLGEASIIGKYTRGM